LYGGVWGYKDKDETMGAVKDVLTKSLVSLNPMLLETSGRGKLEYRTSVSLPEHQGTPLTICDAAWGLEAT